MVSSSKRVNDYVAFRKAYLKVGELLEQNQVYYDKVLQNQKDIKDIITKGWGY